MYPSLPRWHAARANVPEPHHIRWQQKRSSSDKEATSSTSRKLLEPPPSFSQHSFSEAPVLLLSIPDLSLDSSQEQSSVENPPAPSELGEQILPSPPGSTSNQDDASSSVLDLVSGLPPEIIQIYQSLELPTFLEKPVSSSALPPPQTHQQRCTPSAKPSSSLKDPAHSPDPPSFSEQPASLAGILSAKQLEPSLSEQQDTSFKAPASSPSSSPSENSVASSQKLPAPSQPPSPQNQLLDRSPKTETQSLPSRPDSTPGELQSSPSLPSEPPTNSPKQLSRERSGSPELQTFILNALLATNPPNDQSATQDKKLTSSEPHQSDFSTEPKPSGTASLSFKSFGQPTLSPLISSSTARPAITPLQKRAKSLSSIQEIRIAVVGRTGSGLSQFIHDITQTYEHGVSDKSSLDPFTMEITPVETVILGVGNLVLIDTPGFDFSKGNTEYDRFNDLAKWMEKTYGGNGRLDGIVYMHNIWNKELDRRAPFHTCDALEKVCGHDWRRKIVLVNSHWSELVEDDGNAREKHLEAGYWGVMLKKGSKMMRYEEPQKRDRAVEILKMIIGSHRSMTW
ncbi:hypothetical protein AN958_10650 [Leucoagaricus sp. SymC.cos]|nr:hypothetical protein AN958_10650 [Leucoagaricus sp. SymC.cos]